MRIPKVKNAATNAKISHRWTVLVTVWAFVLSLGLGALITQMERVPFAVACVVLVALIGVGILFDIVALAVTTASEAPFHAMAAQRVAGAKESIAIIRAAQQIASFCSDVIGDISGIVCGTMIAIIAARLIWLSEGQNALAALILTALVAAVMIGGKAAGKGMALMNNNSIVFIIGRMLTIFRVRRKK